jgi:hypothetical protein
MKSIKEINKEISGKCFNLRDLDKYMVEAGYHSILPDADLETIAEDEAVVYLGKEKEAEVIINLLVTRRSPMPEAFRMVVIPEGINELDN